MIDFDALSAKQLDVLGQISIGDDGGHSPKTVRSLVEKGLIVRIAIAIDGPFTTWGYEMPIPVHMEWCAWCSRQVEAGKV